MRLYNSPDIFQEKMNELFHGIEYVRAFIEDFFNISNGNFEDRLNKTNAEKLFVARDNLEYLGFEITTQGIIPLPD